MPAQTGLRTQEVVRHRGNADRLLGQPMTPSIVEPLSASKVGEENA